MDHPLVSSALKNFEATRSSVANFQDRPGQAHLVLAIAQTLAEADFSDSFTGAPQVLVAEAGTGTGKTAAFVPSALTIAKSKGVRLVVSTATVALMEQLIHRDLPTMASTYPGGFTFGQAKGRGRYFCPAKADVALGEGLQSGLELDENDPQPLASRDAASVAMWRTLAESFDAGEWNGDRDTLPADIPGRDWMSVAADRASCTGRHCGHFKNCPYYNNKRSLVKVDVIVTNHDLLLSSLVHGSGIVPTPDKAVYVLDESHHLPSIAIGLSEHSADVSSPRWPASLARAGKLAAAAGLVQARMAPDIAPRLSERLRDLERAMRDFLSGAGASGETYRFLHGQIQSDLNDLVNEVLHICADWLAQCFNLVAELKEGRVEGDPKNDRINRVLVDIAGHQRHLDELHAVLSLFANESATRCAKWVSLSEHKSLPALRLHACPLSGAPTLRQHLWKRSRGVILTSATLRTLGSFDFFLRESGLRSLNPRTEVIESPFDYERQGQIIVSKTAASPSGNLDLFVKAMIPQLFQDLAAVQRGALVLFSSRAMMDQVVKALPDALRPLTLVQGKKSRDQMLAAHRKRVAQGKPSILMGMASLGEGLDLPGAQCESVHIPKLPFAMPSTPIEEARAEAVTARGGNPFMALSVPATGMTVTQWVGRGIRTETDRATIVFYDPRLVDKAYGKQLLGGLPPFRKTLRLPSGATQAINLPHAG